MTAHTSTLRRLLQAMPRTALTTCTCVLAIAAIANIGVDWGSEVPYACAYIAHNEQLGVVHTESHTGKLITHTETDAPVDCHHQMSLPLAPVEVSHPLSHRTALPYPVLQMSSLLQKRKSTLLRKASPKQMKSLFSAMIS